MIFVGIILAVVVIVSATGVCRSATPGVLRESSQPALPLIVGLILGLASLIAYIAVWISEENDSPGEVAPFAVPLVGAILGVVVALLAHGRTRALAATGSGVVFAVLGMLAIFSFGLLLFAAGMCCLWASGVGRGPHSACDTGGT